MPPSLRLTTASSRPEEAPGSGDSAWAIFARFLRFGMLAWGGPMAQIAMIRRELVDELGWISHAKFNRVLAVYQALPGPEAHELCVYFGMLRGGRLGGLLAGLGFMLPGLLLMLLLAWIYSLYGIHPLFAAAMAGCQPAVVALIVRAVHRIGSHALGNLPLLVIAGIGLGLTLGGAHFALVLTGGGVAYATWRAAERFKLLLAIFTPMVVIVTGAWLQWRLGFTMPIGAIPPEAPATVHVGPTVGELLGMGLRAGLLSFGGAYTAIPFLRRDAVEIGAWMSPGAFLDGIALGGVIPAPLVILGTFVGFQCGGLEGALIVTAGIFAPAFGFTLLGHDVIEHLVENKTFHALLDGVTAATIGLIAATAIELGRSVLFLPSGAPGVRAMVTFAAALALLYLLKTKWVTPALVLGAAGVGLLWR